MDLFEPTIEYRPIPGFPGYRIGSDGSMWTCKNSRYPLRSTWRRMYFKPDQGGYYTVSLWRNNARTNKRLHVLVLECFVCPRPLGMLALHKNDSPLDNRLENLYWGTYAENGRDATRNARCRIGISHPQCKVPEETAHLIRSRAAQGESHTTIAADFHISRTTVGNIVHGRTRRYATAIVGEETRLAEEQIARPILRKPRHYIPRSRRKSAKEKP